MNDFLIDKTIAMPMASLTVFLSIVKTFGRNTEQNAAYSNIPFLTCN